MKPAHRFALIFLAAIAASLLVVSLIQAGTTQLKNDNDDPWGSSQAGRSQGDIDATVFLQDDIDDLFPITIRSVQLRLHLPTASDPEYAETVRVRAQIYTLGDGAPTLVAESDVRQFTRVDSWLTVPFADPVTLNTPTTVAAAIKWESGDPDFHGIKAYPLAIDSNNEAPQSVKDARNLFHRSSVHAPLPCQVEFCNHTDIWGEHAEIAGFNMIRVTIDSPAVTPAPPTSTPRPTKPASTATPLPTPGRGGVYLPTILRNFQAGASALSIGNGRGEAESFALTSGADVADQCWHNLNGDDYPLWVGREEDHRRGVMRSLIWFDLNALPQSAVLLGAELRLMAVEVSPDTGETMPVYVHRVNQTWPNCPTWNSAATIHAEQRAQFSVNDVGQYSVDITVLVQGWVSGAYPNHGLMLQTDESVAGRVRGFVSAASTQEDLRPVLNIRYR